MTVVSKFPNVVSFSTLLSLKWRILSWLLHQLLHQRSAAGHN